MILINLLNIEIFFSFFQSLLQSLKYLLVILNITVKFPFFMISIQTYFTLVHYIKNIIMTDQYVMTKQMVEKAIHNELMDQDCMHNHGGGCLKRSIRYFFTGCHKFTKLYFFYLLAVQIVLRRKQLLKEPIKQIKNFIKGFIRSMLFGGTYLGVSLFIMCGIARFYKNSGDHMMSGAGISGGIALMIQSPQRQPQIALFILNQALKALYNMAQRRNLLLNIPEGFGILYAMSVASICYHYFNNRQAMSSKYTSFMDKILKDS